MLVGFIHIKFNVLILVLSLGQVFLGMSFPRELLACLMFGLSWVVAVFGALELNPVVYFVNARYH